MENQEQKPITQVQQAVPAPQEAPTTEPQPVVPKRMSFWQKLRFNLRGGKYRNRYNEDVNKVKATRAAEKEAHMAKPQKQTYQVNTPQAAPVGPEAPAPQPAAPVSQEPVAPSPTPPSLPNQNANGAQNNQPKPQS